MPTVIYVATVGTVSNGQCMSNHAHPPPSYARPPFVHVHEYVDVHEHIPERQSRFASRRQRRWLTSVQASRAETLFRQIISTDLALASIVGIGMPTYRALVFRFGRQRVKAVHGSAAILTALLPAAHRRSQKMQFLEQTYYASGVSEIDDKNCGKMVRGTISL